MNYTSILGVLLSFLSTALGWTADMILEDFYDSSLASDKPERIIVGVQTSMEEWGLGDEGAFFLNINRINNQAEILPNHHIEPVVRDDGHDSQRAFFVGLELNGVDWGHALELNESVDFLFGGAFSGTSLSSAFVSHSFNTPQMSCTATSSVLSDKTVYGTFSRTISSDATQSCAWAAIASFFNWTNIGVISSKTDYGLGLSKGFADCVDTFNITIKEEITFESNVTEHSAKLATIANSDIFIYFVAMHNDDIKKLAKSLDEMGLAGFPYVYIGSDAAGEDTDLLKQILPGLMYTAPFQVVEDTNELVTLTNLYEAANEAWAEENGEDPSTGGIGVYAPYCWDVALMIAHFFHNFTEMYPELDTARAGDYWISFLKAYQGEGATGELGYDDNLDPALNRWTISNCDNSTCNAIGVATSTGGPMYFNLYDAANVYWPGGLSGIENTPLDHTTTTLNWIYVSNHAKVFYGIFCGFTIIVTIGLVVLSYSWRDRKAVRMSAWKLNILTLIGLDITLLSLCFSLLDDKDYSQEKLDDFCFARVLFFFIGFPLFTGTIFSKVWRVHKIFNSRRYSEQRRVMKDTNIMRVVGIYMACNLIFIIVYQQLFPWRRVEIYGSLTQIDIMNYEETVWGTCEMDQFLSWWLGLCIGNGYVLLLGAKWAWDTRKVVFAALNDSVQIGYILMLIILLAAFNLICLSILNNPDWVFFINFISLLLVAWFTIGVLFLYKLWSNSQDDESEENSTSRHGGERKCPHCNEIIDLNDYSQYSILESQTPRGLASGSRGEVEMAEPAVDQFSTTKPTISKSIEDMDIDELLETVDLENNSVFEDGDLDIPKSDRGAIKE